MKIVISIGGSLLTKELTAKHYKKYINVLLKLKKKGHKLIAVCGAGKLKIWQKIARDLGANRFWWDMVGTIATHVNATTIASGLDNNAYWIGWKSERDAIKEMRRYFGRKILVCGGYEPGHSTDYDVAIFANAINADLIVNATNVSGVYSSDPRKYPDAKKFKRLSYSEFLRILKKNLQIPGEYRLFDLKAAKLLKKVRIKLIIVNGTNPNEIIRAIEGRHSGTTIV